MKPCFLVAILVLCFSTNANADLILNLSGQSGSSILNLSASGSVEVLQQRNFSVFTVQSSGGSNPIFNGDVTGEYTFDLPVESTLAFRGGGFFREFETLEITVNNFHTVTLRTPGFGPLSVGTILSIEGDATLDLSPSVLNYDRFNPGSYSTVQASTTGVRTLNVSAPVPEPSGIALLSIATACCGLSRRRKLNTKRITSPERR